MSAAMTGEEPRRAGASGALACALVASLFLHALVLAALPSPRELSAPLPAEPEPLVVRVVHVAPPAAPASPVAREIREAPPAPRSRAAKPAPAPEPEPEVPLAASPPVPTQEAAARAPATPVAAAAPMTLARIDVRDLVRSAPATDSGALERYRSDISNAAERFKLYPRAAIDNNWEGEVVVLMAIGADGGIDALRVRSGSGYDILDRQALDMFRTAKHYVQIPRELRGKRFEVELRARYGLRDQASG